MWQIELCLSHECNQQGKLESRKGLAEVAKQKLDTILAILLPGRQRAIRRIVKGKTSSWLTTLPLQSCHYDFAPVQFRDRLSLHYLQHPPNLPAKCDGCGFSNMPLTARKDPVLLILCHNEICDCIGDLASQV